MRPKAESVTVEGVADGFVPPLSYDAEVLDGGFTRLVVSAPWERIKDVHRSLITALEAPLGFLYVQLTDRSQGQLPKPRQWVAMELTHDRLLDCLERFSSLVYEDGRNQVWVRGGRGEQVVLEETGVLFVYPDDPSFRDALLSLGVPESKTQTMESRDYVKVNFYAENDDAEPAMMKEMGFVRWDG